MAAPAEGQQRARARQDSSHLLLRMVYSQVQLLQELEEENRAVGVDLCIGLANRPGPGLEVAKTPGGCTCERARRSGSQLYGPGSSSRWIRRFRTCSPQPEHPPCMACAGSCSKRRERSGQRSWQREWGPQSRTSSGWDRVGSHRSKKPDSVHGGPTRVG